MWLTVMGVIESKTSPRHLNIFRQLKKTTEVLPLLRVLFLDTPGHPTSTRNTETVANTPYYMHITISFLLFFLSPRGSQGRT